MTIFSRPPRQARTQSNAGLDPRHFEHDHEPLVLRGQRPDLLAQHREKKTLNVVLGVG